MHTRSHSPARLMGNHWHPTRETAYQAAEMVTHGKCAAQIAQQLFNTREGRDIQRVERLLQYAQQNGVFTLACPTNEPLERRLADHFDPQVSFHVVNNDQAAYAENARVDEAFRADAVARQAAEVVGQRINKLLAERRDKKKRIVVANAGGFAVSRVVRFLASRKLVPEECDTSRLLFVSLNSASMPSDYGRSANTLAVRMAEIYGGNHIALCPIWPEETRKQYEQAVSNIDLLICGAGSKHGLLFTWLKDHARIALPVGAVGDLCLIPISDLGTEVPLEHNGPAHVRKFLNPHPSFTELRGFAARDRIIFVAMGYQHDDRPPNAKAGEHQTHSKLAVTRAILKYALTRTCVLGATLAHDLLDAASPAPA